MLKAIHTGEGIAAVREGHPSDREAARAAANQGRRPRQGGGRGDARLVRFP